MFQPAIIKYLEKSSELFLSAVCKPEHIFPDGTEVAVFA
jgi:hypothetical protein